MLNFPSSTRIYVASEPVDIRKGFDALAGWVEKNGLDVYSGHVFVFLSKRMTHLKALTWSRGGFVILFKRLERGRPKSVKRHARKHARRPGSSAPSCPSSRRRSPSPTRTASARPAVAPTSTLSARAR